MMSRPTIEEAEAMLMISFSKLTWILPSLLLFETFLAYYTDKNIDIINIDLVSLFSTILLFITVMKLINIIDKHLEASRKQKR